VRLRIGVGCVGAGEDVGDGEDVEDEFPIFKNHKKLF